MEDENENNEQQNKIENLEEEYGDLKADVYFLNSTIKEVELPISLNEFREKIKDLFLIKNRKNDEIFVIYSKEENGSETSIEVKTDEDYIELLKTIKESEIKDNTILIEIDKVPSETNRTIPDSYEEEIQCVVERELKGAAERIKKYLSGNKKCYPCAMSHKKMCSKCGRSIYGDLYKSVTDIEEKYYCERCSFNQKEPCFIIH
jgi:hypothetical protein